MLHAVNGNGSSMRYEVVQLEFGVEARHKWFVYFSVVAQEPTRHRMQTSNAKHVIILHGQVTRPDRSLVGAKIVCQDQRLCALWADLPKL